MLRPTSALWQSLRDELGLGRWQRHAYSMLVASQSATPGGAVQMSVPDRATATKKAALSKPCNLLVVFCVAADGDRQQDKSGSKARVIKHVYQKLAVS